MYFFLLYPKYFNLFPPREKQGTIEKWYRCNLSLRSTYDFDIDDVIPFHKNLIDTNLQVLLYTYVSLLPSLYFILFVCLGIGFV